MSNNQPDTDDAAAENGTDWTNTGSPTGGDSAEDDGGWGGSSRRSGSTTAGQTWLSQLQAIIDNLATQSAPVVREVGAKAAEIAALAADRAGPFAQRAAEATANASVRMAERSRSLAAELRRPTADAAPDTTGGNSGSDMPGGHDNPDETELDGTAPIGPTV